MVSDLNNGGWEKRIAMPSRGEAQMARLLSEREDKDLNITLQVADPERCYACLSEQMARRLEETE